MQCYECGKLPRKREYKPRAYKPRAYKPRPYKPRDKPRVYQPRAYKPRPMKFIGVDGEGCNIDGKHEYVLLGVGEEHISWEKGCRDVHEIFEFLWSQYLAHPDAAFVGFYLTYDWNCWLRNLPRNRVERLFSPQDRQRKSKCPYPFPVEFGDWEFDILWKKRFKLRRKGSPSWMSICDAGPFFQMSLVKVLESRSESAGITELEVSTILEGKAKRASAGLDADMIRYNRTENIVLAKLMTDLSCSLKDLGVPLSKSQYHGPGQAAQKWIKDQHGNDQARKRVMSFDKDTYNALRYSYVAGIFEVCAHGRIPGLSYEYDINSAYPSIISQLPCVCGKWVWGKSDGLYTLVHARVVGSDPVLGPLPFRTIQGNIMRPQRLKGWYWLHEIEAAQRAQLIERVDILQSITYYPCKHGRIYANIADLYLERMRVGKESSKGKACKLIYNSVYGKFAQSIGVEKDNSAVSNAVYASLITAGCRTMILDAIASHPSKSADLLMIATDAVFFRTPHPGLTLSHNLGEWEETRLENLTIFKPGMYWDHKSRDILAGRSPKAVVKTRGVSRAAFEKVVEQCDEQFSSWNFNRRRVKWPEIEVPVNFYQESLKSALNRSHDDEKFHGLLDGISTNVRIRMSSDPVLKRKADMVYYDGKVYRTRPYTGSENTMSAIYKKTFGYEGSLDIDAPDGPVTQLTLDLLGL